MSTFTCPIVTVKTVTLNMNSDNLDILTFEEIGWVCQDVRGKRKVGDKVIYIPIDSLVDCSRLEFEFLMKNAKMRKVRPLPESEEVLRPLARIKTIKLRGEISQGLVIDLPNEFWIQIGQDDLGKIDELYGQYIIDRRDDDAIKVRGFAPVGTDASPMVGVTKYEPPQEAVFSANAKGNFPSWCPKTDAERYQNVNRTIEPYLNDLFSVSIKIDGTSMTVFYDRLREGDEFGVCSRNQELKPPEQDPSASVATKYGFAMDSYWKAATEQNLREKIYAIAVNNGYQRVALQFELAGEGIQKNTAGIKGQLPWLFDIYVTKEGFEGYLDYIQMIHMAEEYDILTVPIVWKTIPLSELIGNPPDFSFLQALKYPSGHPIEGLVFVSAHEKFVGKLGRLKFKYVNQQYLLKTEKDDE